MENPKLKTCINDIEKFQLRMPVETNMSQDGYFLKEKTGPGLYQLHTHTISECNQEAPGFINSGIANPTSNLVNLESQFRGLSNINTRCPDMKIDPLVTFKKEKNVFSAKCTDELKNIYTKEKKGCSSVTMYQQNRFDYLSEPMLVQQNSYIGTNTRLQSRDAVKPVNRNQHLPNPCNCGRITESHFSSDCSYLKDRGNNFITNYFLKK